MKKEPLDKLLVEKGFFESREQARAAILAGLVRSREKRLEKAGELVSRDVPLSVERNRLPYVSRGGLKLEGALFFFCLSAEGLVVLDVGASTGGFTDCLLQHGAKKVYAVDVGYGQLALKLRQDPRVRIMEKVNARHLKETDFPEWFDLCTVDVSFISLRKILPAIFPLLKPGGKSLSLIKPQFEVRKGEVGNKGVVRDSEKHRQTVQKIKEFAMTLGFLVNGTVESPLQGPTGNREFFVLLEKPGLFIHNFKKGQV